MANRLLIRITHTAIGIIALCAYAKGQIVFQIPDSEPVFILYAQFAPNPASPGLPEFIWTGPGGNFETGPGCVGNGDGDLPLSAQTPGGLQVDTQFIVPNIPNSTIDGSGTHFFDVTLSLSSNTDPQTLEDTGNGSELTTVDGTPINEAEQWLSNGSFALYTTPANDSPAQQAAGPILLLSGTLTNDRIITSSAGSFTANFAANITLTGGAIFNAFGFGYPEPECIITLTTASPITVNTGTVIFPGIFSATIDPFNADATSVVPEPQWTGIASFLTLAFITNSRRRLRATRL